MAVAVLRTKDIEGDIVATPHHKGIKLVAHFTKLPAGKHGFHIHKAGDLRGEGCHGLCEHFDKGHHKHGDAPTGSKKERHTGDLGNIAIPDGRKEVRKTYYLPDVSIQELWGRSIIVHEGEDDLGRGSWEDSHTTGHSGARMGCAIFGRMACPLSKHRTRKAPKK